MQERTKGAGSPHGTTVSGLLPGADSVSSGVPSSTVDSSTFTKGVFSLRFHSDFSLDRADVAGGGGPELSRGSFDWSRRCGGCWSGGARQMGKRLGWEPGQQTKRRGNMRTGSPEPPFLHISTM